MESLTGITTKPPETVSIGITASHDTLAPKVFFSYIIIRQKVSVK